MLSPCRRSLPSISQSRHSTLGWELILVPLLTLLSLLSAFGGVTLGGTTAWSTRAGSRARLVAGLIVIGLLLYTTVRLVQNAGTTDWADLASSLALPVWLTLWALPFIWAMSAFVEYDSALRHLRIATTDGRIPWKSVLALIVSFRYRRAALHKFAGRWPRDLVTADGFRDARSVIAKQQAEVKAEAAAKKRAADDLKRYAEVVGRRHKRGRQLDKREFEATVEAPTTWRVQHMAWYGNHTKPLPARPLGEVRRGVRAWAPRGARHHHARGSNTPIATATSGQVRSVSPSSRRR